MQYRQQIMTDPDPRSLVSVDWLSLHLDAPDVRIVDASWHLPGSDRDPKAEYKAEHIPGAVFFDIDDISDQSSDLPHMMPRPEKFAARVRKLGLGDGHRIIIYDNSPIWSAARVWWMFRYMGHLDVAVLDGGLSAWKAAGKPTNDMTHTPRERHFIPRVNSTLVRDVTEVARATKLLDEQIVDARSQGRFAGIESEPREGLRSGHIPGSKNVCYLDVLQNGQMKTAEDIRATFSQAGVDLTKPIITSCGSGITACVLALALERAGHHDWSVYDGSWTEWGAFEELPIQTGNP